MNDTVVIVAYAMPPNTMYYARLELVEEYAAIAIGHMSHEGKRYYNQEFSTRAIRKITESEYIELKLTGGLSALFED